MVKSENLILGEIPMTLTRDRILLEQLRIQHKGSLPTLFSVLISCVLYSFVLWNETKGVYIIAWMGCTFLLHSIHFILLQTYWKQLNHLNKAGYKLGSLSIISISGMLWGASVLLFFPSELEYQLFMLFMLAGLSLGGASTLTAYMPCYYAYLFTSMLPIAIAFLSEGKEVPVFIGLTTFIYIIFVSLIGLNTHHSLIETLKLRFENESLVKRLTFQKQEAEKANLAKSKFLASASHDLSQPLHGVLGILPPNIAIRPASHGWRDL